MERVSAMGIHDDVEAVMIYLVFMLFVLLSVFAARCYCIFSCYIAHNDSLFDRYTQL